MKINVGAGPKGIEGYINIDRSTGGEAYPLSQNGVVFETGVADEIRASHVLEHFSHRDTLMVLKEWIRVLKPNGELKIAVPDFDQIISLRSKGDPLWFAYLMGGHTDNNDMHGAVFTRQGLKDLMREAGCIVPTSDEYWNDELDYCSNHPSGVSLNIRGIKREDVVDVPKPIVAKARKIMAIMSCPRVAFTDFYGEITNLLRLYGIPCVQYRGAFWEQGIQNCIQKAIDEGYDDVVTLDFDTIVDQKQFERMLSHWLEHPEVDALTALQPKRGEAVAMLTPAGVELSGKVEQMQTTHEKCGMRVRTAHFGLTFLRLEKVAKMRRPWFWNQPAPMMLPLELDNEFDRFVSEDQTKKFLALFDKYFGLRFKLYDGTSNQDDSGKWKTGGAIDADIYFWLKWEKEGNNLFILTDVQIGHLEVLVASHNPVTGIAQHRYASEWNNQPFAGKPADVQSNNFPKIETPINDYVIDERNAFDDARLFINDKYPQSFIQHSRTCLGEPSKDLSGSAYSNVQGGIISPLGNRKQRRIYVTFSGKRYDDTTRCIVDNAPHLGADSVLVYDDRWLIDNHPEFIEARKDIFLNHIESAIDWRNPPNNMSRHIFTRGFGWFCWKPFIIQHALDNFCEDGDIVLFTDADTYPINDLTPFYDHADKHGCMLFAAAHLRQRHWCKRNTMAAMGMDVDKWRDMQAGNARYMAFKKGSNISNSYCMNNLRPGFILKSWLDLASDKNLTTFELSKNEYPELIKGPDGKALGQHRCEQAILTNLANYYGIPLHRPPCQDGNGYLV